MGSVSMRKDALARREKHLIYTLAIQFTTFLLWVTAFAEDSSLARFTSPLVEHVERQALLHPQHTGKASWTIHSKRTCQLTRLLLHPHPYPPSNKSLTAQETFTKDDTQTSSCLHQQPIPRHGESTPTSSSLSSPSASSPAYAPTPSPTF